MCVRARTWVGQRLPCLRGFARAQVNDYLARRDAENVGQIHRFLGLSVGLIQAPMQPPERRQNYARDITCPRLLPPPPPPPRPPLHAHTRRSRSPRRPDRVHRMPPPPSDEPPRPRRACVRARMWVSARERVGVGWGRYVTNSELGFDYLRDNLALNPEGMVRPAPRHGTDHTMVQIIEW